MIKCFINGQRLTVNTPLMVAGTVDYFEVSCKFQNDDWNGLHKWMHFHNGDTVYDVEIIDDGIAKGKHLNLSAGEWKVWLHGSEYVNGELVERITTDSKSIIVIPTGSTGTDNPFPSAEPSVVEQIYAELDATVQTAVDNAIPGAVDDALEKAKSSGEFNGTDGKSAYQSAVDNGFEGTETEWLASLKVKGDPGDTPVKGEDYYTEKEKAEIVADVLEEVGGKQVQVDWNQNDLTQPDCILNRPFGDEIIEILPKTEATFAATEETGGMPVAILTPTGIAPSLDMMVFYNGVRYDLTAVDVSDGGDLSVLVVGDQSAMGGGTSTGEPFLIMISPSSIMAVPLDGSARATIAIECASVKQIDKRFIPYEEPELIDLVGYGLPTVTSSGTGAINIVIPKINNILTSGIVRLKIKVTGIFPNFWDTSGNVYIRTDKELEVTAYASHDGHFYTYLDGYILIFQFSTSFISAKLVKFTDFYYDV